ncbi:unnamed protein product [Diatraea saccharalis]|uniref:Uncharacterized protein n=1 Tax=Diatraea saccharalis TaxID=40085 RepID=A0A9N9N1T6_9NEOP|nr:unnamed protein product [Diatraea saccharalis]
MLCLTVLLIILNIVIIEPSNVGSTIFYNRRGKTECWTEDELMKLSARKLFQGIIPPQVTPDKVNDKFIKETLRYYKGAVRISKQSVSDDQLRDLLKQALFDAIGGHLRSEMLPTVRFAYYAGYVSYKHVRQIHDFYESSKTILNTKGLGWREPEKVPRWSNMTVAKVLIGSGKLLDPCAYLITKRDSNSCINIPTPKLDDHNEPSAIALPFNVGGLVSLTSPHSENILLKYYTSATRCILRSSPQKCRHPDFVNFNNELWHWMKRDIAPHLLDEKLYAAFGGVLRVAAAVQSYGKGLSRRNLFEYQDSGISKWHPWRALSESYITVNADWTPTLYVGMVLMAALLICMLQVCYNYIFGSDKWCQCTGRTKRSRQEEVTYATVDTTFPSMLQTKYSNDNDGKRYKRSRTKTKSSHGSVKTQCVYDFNENTEKLMEIIMSGNEGSETDSPPLSKRIVSDEPFIESRTEKSKHHKNVPELQTSISQLRIEKKPQHEKSSTRMYTTSTVSHSDRTYLDRHASESMWTGSASTSSDRTATSEYSKTPSRKSRSSRDLAWARRVVTKHAAAAQNNIPSTTTTDFDINSFTTPPSRR